MRYIDKDALVAEIEKRYETNIIGAHSAFRNGKIEALREVKTLINTLEVKEEVTTTDAFIEKAKEAFCKATCNGHPPRNTCTSLGTCKEYDNFVKLLKRE